MNNYNITAVIYGFIYKSFLKLLFFFFTVNIIFAQQTNDSHKIYEKAFTKTSYHPIGEFRVKGFLYITSKFFRIRKSSTSSIENSHHKSQIMLDGIGVTKDVIIIILIAALVWVLIHFKLRQIHFKFNHIVRNQGSIKKQNHINVSEPENKPEFRNILQQKVGENNEDTNKKRNEPLMTLETESKLLKLLDEFEKGHLFNSKIMSLPFLAGEFNTNTKYLSYVINQHKSADFKSYVNHLRINYIVEKLASKDEKYRQYKISILAEECGFSSHSKFTSVFKSIKGMSPSVYIKYLEDGKHNKIIHFRENK